MRINTVLIVLLVVALPLTAAIVGENATAAGNIPELSGSGTSADPYLISSANDLRIMSSSYTKHAGAYYKQTSDIVFNDAGYPGDRVLMTVSVSAGKVTGRITLSAAAANKTTSATIYLNGSPVTAQINTGAIDFEANTALLKDMNAVTAVGTLDGNDFGITAKFPITVTSHSASAPIRGNFTPIGTMVTPFSGTYDGNGRSITGIKAVLTGSENVYAGLFGCLGNATVADVTILSPSANPSYFLTNVSDSGIYLRDTPAEFSLSSAAGSIAGSGGPSSSVTLCRNEAEVLSNVNVSRSHNVNDPFGYLTITYDCGLTAVSSAGGIAGRGVRNIYGCENTGNVISAADSTFAFTATSSPQPQNNKYICDLRTYAYNYAGGIIGEASNAKISASGNSGAVSAASDISVNIKTVKTTDLNVKETFETFAGGTIGSSSSGNTVSDVYNIGSVSASCAFSHTASGLVKESEIALTFNMAAGGIAGSAAGSGTIARAYNGGRVAAAGTSSATFGGIQSAAGVRYAGHIIGMADGTAKEPVDCYFTEVSQGVQITGNRTHSATKVSAWGTLSQGAFRNWDFDRIWAVSNGCLRIWIRTQMMMIDTSGTYDGTARYSLSIAGSFDGAGTLTAYVDRSGFALTLKKDYETSKIELYLMSGGTKVVLTKGGNGNYAIPQQYLTGASSITLYIGGLVADPIRSMTITDTSGTYDGTVRYSLNIAHSFDKDGKLSATVDKKGFILTLKKDYETSKIEVYMDVGGKKTVLAKDGSGAYTIPLRTLLDSPSITLYIGGLAADPVRNMTIADTSGTYDGTARYSIDKSYSFDKYGKLSATIDKNGFAITLNGDYVRSEIQIYMMIGTDKIAVAKDGNGRYVVPLQHLLNQSAITLCIDGLVADPIRGMRIIDTSGTYDGTARYSVTVEHSFDGNGTLSGIIDKKGFSVALKKDYGTSEIEMYMLSGSERTMIEKDGSGNYIVPLRTLIDSPSVTLYIDGLAADPVRDMTIIDTSGTYDGAARYSIDREHQFDGNGTLFGEIDKNGFAIALNKDYSGSEIRIYMMIGSERTMIEKDGEGNYTVPLQVLLDSSAITLYIEGLVADPVRDMTIIDTSGTYDGTPRYSIDREHQFDGNGTLFGEIDKNGFALTLKKDYSGSEIEIYMTIGSERTIIGKGADGRYNVPMQALLDSSAITLYIDGLAADPVRDMIIVDTSGQFGGTAKYAIDGEHYFDANGTLFGTVGKSGFALTLKKDYSGSKTELYMMVGSEKTTIGKDGNGNYIVPLQTLLNASAITLYIGGLTADPIRIMTMIDTSGTYDGTLRYSIDREYYFDNDGTLFAEIDKDGFVLTLEKEYSGSKIGIYIMSGNEKTFLMKDGKGRYNIPVQTLLDSSAITLYIDGLVPNGNAADVLKEIDVPKEAEVPKEADVRETFAQASAVPDMTAFISVFALIALGAGLTVVNAMRTGSILKLSADAGKKKDEQKKQTGGLLQH